VRMVDCLGEAAPHGVSIARAALSSTQDVVLRSQAAHALVRAAAGTEHERDAIKTVLALAQRDPEILDALAAKATHDGAVLLATRLNDPEPSVAAGAARALRGLAGTATVAELVPILATADFPLAARLLVLGTRPYSEQLQTAASTAMAEAFRESSPEQRDMALALATRYSEPATALYPQIRTFLGDADVSTRIHAIEALGNACTEGAREDLLRVLGADAAAERAAAATALKMRYRLPRNTEFPWKIWDLRTCIPFTAEYERETTRVADALVRQLSSDPNEAVRLAAADALANVSCCSAELGAQLLQRLPSETSPDVRSLIWTALSWSYGVDFVFLRDASAVARIETDASVGQYAVHALRVIEDRLTPPGVVEATLGRPPEPGSVTPLFPLPPPSFTAFARVPAELLGTANTELATVHGRLLRAFEYLGFPEPAVFQTPGGFALVTNVERIAADGTPMYGRDRFTAGKVPLAKFAPEEWMKRFFFGDERQFRLTVVVLAPEKLRGPSLTITEDAAREWIQHGGTALPAAVATTRLVAVSPVVLFYHFAKTGGTVQLIPETKTPLPGSVHLQKLALLAALERTYP
jgi:hypothetical protein